jgi:hypothetical protein
MRIACAAMLLAGLLAAAPAHAQDGPSILPAGGTGTPNFLGITGLLTAPYAGTLGNRAIGGHVHVHEDFRTFGALAGIGDRFELGLTWADLDSSLGGGDGLLVNAKADVLKESMVMPGLSVGAVDIFDELDVDTSWFVVASKRIPRILGLLGFSLHLGYGGGVYSDDVFAGAEINLGTPLDALPISHPTFSLMGEYVNDRFNIGLRGKWRGLGVTVGVFDWDDFGGGISYSIKLP